MIGSKASSAPSLLSNLWRSSRSYEPKEDAAGSVRSPIKNALMFQSQLGQQEVFF